MAPVVKQGRVWALPSLLGVTVVTFAAGSGSIGGLKDFAHGARWLFLFALLGLAFVEALPVMRSEHRLPGGLPVFAPLAAGFAGLAIVSAGWSPEPRLSFERGASLCVLFLTAAMIAVATADDSAQRRRIFAGLGSAAGFIAAFGLLMLALGFQAAAQKASPGNPWRFRGFGENPNTVPVLGAAAMPIVVWLWLTATDRRARISWSASFVTLLGTAIATQSRGGLAGAFVGVSVVLAFLVERWPRKVSAIATFTLVVGLGVSLRELTQPAVPPFRSAITPGRVVPQTPTSGTRRYRATQLPPREDEIGFPSLSRVGETNVASGRVAAWSGAMKLVEQRPILGYGFGTEGKVFVDRWYYFASGLPENSSIGILLQVGVVGFALILGLLGQLLWGCVRALRLGNPEARSLAVLGVGVLAGAVSVTFIQSYIYSVGNLASVTVWVSAFIIGTALLGRGSERQSIGP